MKKFLAPYYNHNINSETFLWFKDSNKYLVLEDKIYTLLDSYLESIDYEHFHNLINLNAPFSKEVSLVFFTEIEMLLTSVNTLDTDENQMGENSISQLDLDKPSISICYNFNGTLIRVRYKSSYEQSLIHPQFSYLETASLNTKAACIFHISTIKDHLYLFKNNLYLGSYSKNAYHLLQGKFAIELLCTLTQTKESDWLATFHASTISNNSEAVMLIGESGKGKSTLSTILMDYGYHLLSDDFTPMLAKSQQVYHYPSAISIKRNSFSLIDSLTERIKYHTFQSPNNHKGLLKYITPINSDKKAFPCSKIILVNYQKDSEASLDPLPISEALNVLIPDSWISPLPEHAKIFMTWLESCDFYKLTYSRTDDAIIKFETLLNPVH